MDRKFKMEREKKLEEEKEENLPENINPYGNNESICIKIKVENEWNVENVSHGNFRNDSTLVEVKIEKGIFDFLDFDENVPSVNMVGVQSNSILGVKTEKVDKVSNSESFEKPSISTKD